MFGGAVPRRYGAFRPFRGASCQGASGAAATLRRMAEALKDSFRPDVAVWVADRVGEAHPPFDREAFLRSALEGFDALELTGRARAIAAALGAHLPEDFAVTADVIARALGPELPRDTVEGAGMDVFRYLPYVYLVAERGLGHFEESMALQHALTRRFTAEFSIRAFIEAHPRAPRARLAEWTRDPSPHVRRLVSEGTRPRLPWAPRLRGLQADPSPLLPLLEALRDDPAEYVRRSVANNLNDISKDHPAVTLEVCRRWMDGAPPPRRALVRHALRTLSRAGDPQALAILGFGGGALRVTGVSLDPPDPRVGESVRLSCTVANDGPGAARALVHATVHFVKARGTGAKTFILGEREIPGAGTGELRTTVSLRQHTTRTHRPGTHRVEVRINGVVAAETAFELRA